MPLTITIPASDDIWDSEREMFVSVKEQTLVLEHSLISVSKWESKWKKSFVDTENKTMEEIMSYVKCMTINHVDDKIYNLLTLEHYKQIEEYIADTMTATTFSNLRHQGKKEIVTAELIYYSMIEYGIPWEFERWHFNRLMALIQVCAIKDGGGGKMSRTEAAAFQKAVNESRLSKGKRR